MVMSMRLDSIEGTSNTNHYCDAAFTYMFQVSLTSMRRCEVWMAAGELLRFASHSYRLPCDPRERAGHEIGAHSNISASQQHHSEPTRPHCHCIRILDRAQSLCTMPFHSSDPYD